MDPRKRLVAVAVALAVIALIATFAMQRKPAKPLSSPSITSSAGASCLALKPQINTPDWYPKDLSMPAGSYPIEAPADVSGLRRVVFAVRGSLREFVVYALSSWKQQGWFLGRGEAEPGEAEDNFIRGKQYGVFRARSIFCDPSRTWVLVVVNDPSKGPVPAPTLIKPSPGVTHTTLQ